MKIADFLRSGEAAIEGGFQAVANVFTQGRSAVTSSKLPDPAKASITTLLNDAESTLGGLTSVAGTELGSLFAEGVEDATTAFNGLVSKLSGNKAVSSLSSAEKVAVAQGVGAMTAQLQTLAAQAQVGIAAVSAAGAKALTPEGASE